MSNYSKRDKENILNAILVNEGVRPACLVQPADYREATGKDPKTEAILNIIKTKFPDLIFSEDYTIYQGIIVSKEDYNGQEISLTKMGEILGYPCYEDFENLDRDKITYSLHINIIYDKADFSLLENVCKDKSNEAKYNKLAIEIEKALRNPEYSKLLDNHILEKVEVEISKNIPTIVIINKLINNEDLDNDDKDKIMNILYNIGFSMDTQMFFQDNFQYNNPIHKGILLGLLLNQRNDILSPFYPLQNYPEQSDKNLEIVERWEKDLIDIITRTKTLDKKYGSIRRKKHNKKKNKKTRNNKI